jgi:hypothetical protein
VRGVIAALAFLLASCSTAGPGGFAVPIDELDLEPRRTTAAAGHVATGPVVEVARGAIDGADFAIVVWSEADGMCLFTMSGADGGVACGPGPPGALQTVGLVMTDAMGQGGPLEVIGIASPEVEDVVAELPDGRRATAHIVTLDPAEIEGSLFLLVLPHDVGDHEIVMLGADGTELERLELVGQGR